MMAGNYSPEVPFDDLKDAANFSAVKRFVMSKGCNVLFAQALAERLAGTGVTVNVAHTEFVKTNILREGNWFVRWVTGLISKPVETAAELPVWIATAPEIAGFTATIYGKKHAPVKPNAYALDRAVQQRLWDASATLTALPA
jgi:NAD(P)-dependent dehydrogenase (short-subunit alcohol dehydrogenase family)